MFAESLLESSPHPEHRSTWTKLASALLQSLMLLIALAIPLFNLERLHVVPPPPSIQLTSPHQVIPEHTPASSRSFSAAPTTPTEIVEPWRVPPHIRGDEDQAPTGPPGLVGVPCTSNCGASITNLLNTDGLRIPPPPNRPPVRPLVVSEMKLGDLVRKVLPEYPTIAKQLHIQGPVVLMATIGKDGRVENVQPVSGPPLLREPARRAVEQWQYRPYLLNREPIVVETQITVNFVLNGER